MADNVTADSGSGGAVFATDECSINSVTVHVPITKLVFGALDTATFVTSSVGLPVGDAGGSLTVDNAGTFAVQATVAAATASIAKAEDAAHASGDTGVFCLAVRSDTAASTAGTDGDYTALITDSTGKLHVNVGNTVTVAAHAVTNAGTFAVQVDGNALTSLQLIDNLVLAEDAAHSSGDPGVMALAVRRDSAAVGSGADGDYSTLNVDGNGRLYVACDTHAVTQSGTWNVGTVTTVTTVSTVTTCSTVSTLTGSGVAHDAADSGNPHKIGAKAETALSGITLVSDGDRTDLHAGVDGVLITRPHCNLEDVVAGNASNTDGASTEVIAAGGAGIKQYLTSCTISNTSSTDTYCEIKSGTTVRWTFPVPANGGVTHSWQVPLPPNAANEAWNFDMGTAVTTARCSMVGFKSKV